MRIPSVLVILVAFPVVAFGQGPATPSLSDYPITAVPLTAVRLTDDFWRPRLEINRTVTVPHILRQNEVTGRAENFLKAARSLGKSVSGPAEAGPYKGQRYNDTDVYKAIEAASYVLAAAPDPALDKRLDDLIAIVAAAQEPDGYLFSARTIDPKNPPPGVGPERWSWLHTSHELYNAGHMYEAAIAHFQATGKRTFLNVAIKNADLVCKVFGPDGRRDVPGHQEIELALVKLARVTGDRKYLDQARFFLDERGRPHTTAPHVFDAKDRFAIYNDVAYRQDHKPVVEQTTAVGHAVRATYLYAGMTDVATLLGVTALARTVEALWQDVTSKRMYVTGGLGSQGRTEAFGDDYALPNRAYAETCASVGGLLWYHRMFLRSGDASYYDVFERTLYNGYLSGVSLSGDAFFYQNPLVSEGKAERSTYFDVACCPANLARLMAQLPGLIYAQRPGEVFVNLFIGSEATFKAGDTPLRVAQQTGYPWQGRVRLRIDPERPIDLTLAVRIPGWSRGAAMPSDLYRFAPEEEGRLKPAPTNEGIGAGVSRPGSSVGAAFRRPELTINGKPIPLTLERGYARISRRWQKGDVVQLDLPMPIRRVVAHDGLVENRGRAAIERGPIVYAAEAIDNGGSLKELRVPLDAELSQEYRKDLLGGVVVVTGNGVVAVPYFAWANRGKGEMAVWIPF